MKTPREKISESIKNGFARIFMPRYRRFEPLSDMEAWKSDGEALRKDWRMIGDDIRAATEQYGRTIGR